MDEKTEQEKIDNAHDVKPVSFKYLRTMLPEEVFNELTDLCRARASFTGKWDYGSVFRELLTVHKMYWDFEDRINNLDLRYRELKVLLNELQLDKEHPEQKEVNKQDSKPDEVQLLGRRKVKEKVVDDKEDEKKNG